MHTAEYRPFASSGKTDQGGPPIAKTLMTRAAALAVAMGAAVQVLAGCAAIDKMAAEEGAAQNLRPTTPRAVNTATVQVTWPTPGVWNEWISVARRIARHCST